MKSLYLVLDCVKTKKNLFKLCFYLFSVNDGIFRQYKSPRDKTSLIEFIVQKTWKKVDPIPSWKSPTSFHMSILSQFFKLSQILRVSIGNFVSVIFFCSQNLSYFLCITFYQ